MRKKDTKKGRRGVDPEWVHTSHNGRKFIRSNEIVKLERFQEQLRKFKKLTEPRSKLV
ncbi:MAG: hypothetical protein ACREK2_02200 [Gemmatimonadota bacterium]